MHYFKLTLVIVTIIVCSYRHRAPRSGFVAKPLIIITIIDNLVTSLKIFCTKTNILADMAKQAKMIKQIFFTYTLFWLILLCSFLIFYKKLFWYNFSWPVRDVDNGILSIFHVFFTKNLDKNRKHVLFCIQSVQPPTISLGLALTDQDLKAQ